MKLKIGILGLVLLLGAPPIAIIATKTSRYINGASTTSNNQGSRYSQKFKQAVSVVFEHEGGYSDDPNDRGGETKYGISKRSYPHLNIATLTKEQAEAIYHRDYWQPEHYREIQDATISTKLLDLSVNIGGAMANRIVQRALKSTGNPVEEDGILGPNTIDAINQADSSDLLTALQSKTADYYRSIAANHPTQQKFLNGWLNRTYS